MNTKILYKDEGYKVVGGRFEVSRKKGCEMVDNCLFQFHAGPQM